MQDPVNCSLNSLSVYSSSLTGSCKTERLAWRPRPIPHAKTMAVNREGLGKLVSDDKGHVVLLTSFGKYMIYQALPWLSVYLGQRTSLIVLVISPLVAIMKNQVVLMKKKGINPVHW